MGARCRLYRDGATSLYLHRIGGPHAELLQDAWPTKQHLQDQPSSVWIGDSGVTSLNFWLDGIFVVVDCCQKC